MSRRRLLGLTLIVALVALTACGSPARVTTLDDEPDLARIVNTVPDGFSGSVNEELERLLAACTAIDPRVAEQVPGLTLQLTDGHCEWRAASTKAPELVVGILVSPGGKTALDQTTSVLKSEREVNDVGDRAFFDPETRALYVLEDGRLWYLQLLGAAPGIAAPKILGGLGRALVEAQSS